MVGVSFGVARDQCEYLCTKKTQSLVATES